jgi:hypothetical protein
MKTLAAGVRHPLLKPSISTSSLDALNERMYMRWSLKAAPFGLLKDGRRVRFTPYAFAPFGSFPAPFILALISSC